jgi:hypothetical protein
VGTCRVQRNARRHRGRSRRCTRHHADRPVIPLANLVRHGVNAWSMRNGRSRRRTSRRRPRTCHPLASSANMQPCWCLGERNARRNAMSRDEARFFSGRIVVSVTRRANRTGQYIHCAIELRRSDRCGGSVRRVVRPSYLPDAPLSVVRAARRARDPDPGGDR